jgi:hypothetical protein
MSKYIVILLVFLATSGCAIVSDNSSNRVKRIEFIGLAGVYKQPEPVSFSIKNYSDKDLYFVCAVERRIKNTWREILPSVSATKPKKSVELFIVKANSMKNMTWDYKIQDFYTNKPTGIFRLKLSVFNAPGAKPDEIRFSDDFEIVNR